MATSSKRHDSHARHGIAVILVLAALSITMALAYALSRSSLSAYKVSANATTGLQAQQAAAAAAALALEKLGKDPNWLPTPSPMVGTLPSGETYRVEVEPGDEPRTLVVTAVAQVIDPKDHHVLAEQSLKIKLAKQRLDNFPASAITAYAARISVEDGPPVYVAAGSSIVGNIRSRGPVVFQLGFTLLGQVYQLPNVLAYRTKLSDYQQYRTGWGGAYAAQALRTRCGIYSEHGLRVKDVVLGPTPTNPMGVYYHEGNVVIEDRVVLNGTLMVKGDIEIRGEQVQLAALREAHDPQSGRTFRTSFPVLVANGSIVFSDDARQVSISGLMLAAKKVQREGDSDDEVDGEHMTDQSVPGSIIGTESLGETYILSSYVPSNETSGTTTIVTLAASTGASALLDGGTTTTSTTSGTSRTSTTSSTSGTSTTSTTSGTGTTSGISPTSTTSTTSGTGTTSGISPTSTTSTTSGTGTTSTLSGTSTTGSTTTSTLPDTSSSATTTATTTAAGPTTPGIAVRGAIMAKRVNLRNVDDRRFQLVFAADTTDVIDAPGFFTWKVVDWTDSP